MANTIQILKEYIEQKGGSDLNIDMLRRGHPRIYFTYRGITKYLVISRSPSDRRALANAKSTVNNLLTWIDNITPSYVEPKETEVKQPSLEVPPTFGERLQYAREQQQLSRERLANVSGIDEDLIKRFEVTKQESLHDIMTALLLSSALKTSLSYLVGEQTASDWELNATKEDIFTQVQPDKIAEAKREALTKEEPAVATPTQPTTSPDQRLYNDVNTLEDFAHFIKFLRQRKGLTQMQIADAIGMTYPSEVSRLERGLWAGGVYNRHAQLAQKLGVPPSDMKLIIDRAIKNAGPSPSMHYKCTPAPRVSPPEPEVIRNVTGPTPGPTSMRASIPDTGTLPTATSMQISSQLPERLELVIREQAEITRALMRSQHQELIDILKTLPTDNNPAEMLHRIVDNLFRKD